MTEIFAMFDANGDGILDKDEYKAFLKGIGEWGAGVYTDKRWDKRWPTECEDLESTTEGVRWSAFKDNLYGQHRAGKAEEDLTICKENPDAAAALAELTEQRRAEAERKKKIEEKEKEEEAARAAREEAEEQRSPKKKRKTASALVRVKVELGQGPAPGGSALAQVKVELSQG